MPKAVTLASGHPHSSPPPIMMRPAYPQPQPHPAYNQAHHHNEVTHWRKMYADLITHYESNGHSHVSPAANAPLAGWLADQQRKYMYNTLTSGQIQQLSLMKVPFIHSSESKLGIKCSEKRCTKFGAFEGKCHNHYYAQYRKDHPVEVAMVHDPEENRNKKKREKEKKNDSNAKKTKGKVATKKPVTNSRKKAVVKESVGKKDAAEDAAGARISPDKDVKMNSDNRENVSLANADEMNDNADASKEDGSDENAAKDEVAATKKKADESDDNSAENQGAKFTEGEKKEAGESKERSSTYAAEKKSPSRNSSNDEDESLAAIDSVEKSAKLVRGDSKAASKENAAAKKAAAKKSPVKKAPAITQGKPKPAKTSLTKDTKPINPVIAAAINTMLANYPSVKSRLPPIAEGIPPAAPRPRVYQQPYPYGWQPVASPAQAPAKTPTLLDQHNQNIWLKHYGSLILFYEQYGHSNVTLQYVKELAPPSLVTWVNQQRERYKKNQLSEDEIERLDLLGFREGGRNTSEKQRCVKDGCNKFAVFDNKCHKHYTQSGKSRKRRASPRTAAHNYFNEPPSKKSKQLTQAQMTEIDSKVTFPVSNGIEQGKKGLLLTPANYAKPVKKKLVKATKPKFPLVNFFKQKDGLWALTIPEPKEESKLEKSPEKSEDQTNEEGGSKAKRGRPKIKKLNDQTNEQVIERIGQYVTLLANAEYCINNKQYYTECKCMHYFRTNSFAVKAVSHAIFDYYKKNNDAKKMYALDRMRQGEQTEKKRGDESEGRFYTLPLVYDYVEKADIAERDGKSKYTQLGALFKHKICSSSWHNLHNHTAKAQETLLQYMDGDITVGVQRNLCTRNFRSNSAREKVLAMLQALYDEHAAEHGTDEVVNGNKVVVLPAVFSKKMLFRKYMADQGWKVEIDETKQKKMANLKDWPLLEGFHLTEKEAKANNGKVAGQTINHTTFAGLWKDEFPHLKIVDGMMKGDAFPYQRDHVRTLLQSLWNEYAVYEDDQDEIVSLPFSRKNLYQTWIREQGWLVKEEKGRMAAYKDWELLPGFYETEEEAAENGGKVAGQKISYASFNHIWKADFPRLQVE